MNISSRNRTLFKYIGILLLFLSVPVIGVHLMNGTKAATASVSLEAENGTLSGAASKVTDTTASGGASVKFNGITTTPPPPPPATGSNCTGATPPAGVSASYQLSFCDDFTATTLDKTKWSFQSTAESDWSSNPLGTGNPANQQLEFDQPANCTLSNGILHMTAKRQTVTSQSGHTYNWTSCMINTSPSYSFRYGYIEERAQFPPVKGFWPALWTWAKPGVSIGGSGETDAFEYYSDNKTILYLTQHNTGGGGCHYTMPFDPTSAMHVYGVDITTGGTTWYVDGKNVCHVATTSGGLTNILVDNFVYSQIPPDAATTQGDKPIDYVRAWQ